MKTLRLAVTIALLLFVGATVGTLVSQEVSFARSTDAGDSAGADTLGMEDRAVVAEAPEGSDDTANAIPVLEDTESQATTTQPLDGSVVSNASDPQGPEEEVAAADAAPCTVRAIYFHNTHRCYTCLKIEETAKGVLETEFADAFSNGRLEWSAINMEQERSSIATYDLSMPTLILVRFVGGEEQEWIALEDTWKLIGSEMRFAMYIEDRVQAFLGACP